MSIRIICTHLKFVRQNWFQPLLHEKKMNIFVSMSRLSPLNWIIVMIMENKEILVDKNNVYSFSHLLNLLFFNYYHLTILFFFLCKLYWHAYIQKKKVSKCFCYFNKEFINPALVEYKLELPSRPPLIRGTLKLCHILS